MCPAPEQRQCDLCGETYRERQRQGDREIETETHSQYTHPTLTSRAGICWSGSRPVRYRMVVLDVAKCSGVASKQASAIARCQYN